VRGMPLSRAQTGAATGLRSVASEQAALARALASRQLTHTTRA
jgi:hypothetical protein